MTMVTKEEIEKKKISCNIVTVILTLQAILPIVKIQIALQIHRKTMNRKREIQNYQQVDIPNLTVSISLLSFIYSQSHTMFRRP